MIQGGSNPYKDKRRHPYEPTSVKPTYGNVNNASRLEPDDFTTSYTSYGLGTSVLNFNKTLNSKLQNYVQNGSFENSDLRIPLPESLLHNVDLDKLQNITQPILDNIQHGTIHSKIPRKQSMTNAQMQVHS